MWKRPNSCARMYRLVSIILSLLFISLDAHAKGRRGNIGANGDWSTVILLVAFAVCGCTTASLYDKIVRQSENVKRLGFLFLFALWSAFFALILSMCWPEIIKFLFA